MRPDTTLLRELLATLGPDAVLSAPESCVAFECDALATHRRTPDLVVLPGSTAEVRSVLRIAAAQDAARAQPLPADERREDQRRRHPQRGLNQLPRHPLRLPMHPM